MNRITALLLAMAAMLVHVLVVHRDGFGSFGPPFDDAHAAYRLARNLAREGTMVWWIDPSSSASVGGLSSYPSPLLVWVASIFELIGITVTRCSQFLGVVCVLFTVALSTRFDTDRIAGVVPALLLVSSGAVAATGASGTEWPLAMVLLVTSFVALEHGRSRAAALALALLVIARPEGVACAAVLLLQTITRRRAIGHPHPQPSLLAFVPAAVTLGAATGLGASILRDFVRALRFDGPALQHGIDQLRDFGVSTVSPVLLVFPIGALVFGELSPVGRRALGLTATWVAFATLLGGGPPAFDIAFAPALPIAFIAIQQGFARALDTYRRSMERLVWIALSLAIFASLFASRFPGDAGQIGLRAAQERVFAARASSPPGQVDLLARSALHSELRRTGDLRRIGTFLRDRLPHDATILTPWPGALGYLSRVQVIDLFGRTSDQIGGHYSPWSPSPGPLDLRAALELEPDYVLPSTSGLEALARGDHVGGLPDSIYSLDPTDGAELRRFVSALLARYEIVVTTGESVDGRDGDPNRWARPLVLLRKRGIQTAPEFILKPTQDRIEIRAGFEPLESTPESPLRRLPQVFDASIQIVRASGARTLIDPAGEPMGDGASSVTLEGFIIDPRWEVPVTLARIPREILGGSDPAVRIEARLLHHRAPADEASSDATAPVVFPLE